jgi:hypothetical protein
MEATAVSPLMFDSNYWIHVSLWSLSLGVCSKSFIFTMCPLLPLIGTQENLAKACHKTDEATFGLGGKYPEAGDLIQHNKPKIRVVPEMEPFTPPKSEDTNWGVLLFETSCISLQVSRECTTENSPLLFTNTE